MKEYKRIDITTVEGLEKAERLQAKGWKWYILLEKEVTK